VMACDDEIIPSQERIETVSDDADLEEVYNTERHLLYVACTRARDHLLVSSVNPASEFLDDLRNCRFVTAGDSQHATIFRDRGANAYEFLGSVFLDDAATLEREPTTFTSA
jgi:superfamily I DNA/RNA helicase